VASEDPQAVGEYRLLRDISKKYSSHLVPLVFPTAEFGGKEYQDAVRTKEFTTKYGPKGLVLLETRNLDERPGWWKYVRPGWNFSGKWLVDASGRRIETSISTLHADIRDAIRNIHVDATQ